LPFYQHPSARALATTVPARLRVLHRTHRPRAADFPAIRRAVLLTLTAAVRQSLGHDLDQFVGPAVYVEPSVVTVVDVFDEEGLWRNSGDCCSGECRQQQQRSCKSLHFDESLLSKILRTWRNRSPAASHSARSRLSFSPETQTTML